MRKFAATFCYLGCLPIAPGTWASAGVVLIFLAWPPATTHPVFCVGFALVASGLCALVGSWAEKHYGEDDPRQVVIDEVAGMLITYCGISTGAAGWLAGFFWFRVFDILKPFPAGRSERLPGGWGIMADDVIAGVYAHIALRLTLWLTGW